MSLIGLSQQLRLYFDPNNLLVPGMELTELPLHTHTQNYFLVLKFIYLAPFPRKLIS